MSDAIALLIHVVQMNSDSADLYARSTIAPASPRFSPLKSQAPSAPTSDGHLTAPPAPVSPNSVKFQSCFSSNPFSPSRVGTVALRGDTTAERPNPGQYLRQLVAGPILDQLLRKIEELPDLQSAAATGTATFED